MKTELLDRMFTCALISLGLFVTVSSWNYGLYRNGVPGPGFFPIIAGLMMTGLAGALLARDLMKRKRLDGRIERRVLLSIAAVTLAIAGFVFGAPATGMGPAAFVIMVAVGYLTEEDDKRDRAFVVRLVLVAAAMAVVCHVVFGQVIGVPLVTGPLNF